MRLILPVLLLCLSTLAPARAQEPDSEGAKDHPMFSRVPGYYISTYDAQDFAAYEFGPDPVRRVEGRYWQITYQVQEGAKKTGPLQIARNHTAPMVQRGGTRLLEDIDASGGTTVARLPVGGTSIWLELQISNNGELFTLTVVEAAGMEQKVEFTAPELARVLADTGTVTLRGVQFDTGKATLRPESATTLATVGELLKGDAALALEIQGHTDNVGTPTANLALSRERSAAVQAYLVERFGIAGSRLTTAGYGDTRPVAPNTTEEGRAQNRRVELVKQ